MTENYFEQLTVDIEFKLEDYQTCLFGVALGENLEDEKAIFISGDTDELLMIISKAIALLVDGKIEDVEKVMKDIHLHVLAECYQESIRKVMEND